LRSHRVLSGGGRLAFFKHGTGGAPLALPENSLAYRRPHPGIGRPPGGAPKRHPGRDAMNALLALYRGSAPLEAALRQAARPGVQRNSTTQGAIHDHLMTTSSTRNHNSNWQHRNCREDLTGAQPIGGEQEGWGPPSCQEWGPGSRNTTKVKHRP
jgi:hypothetical protein